ncbi:type VI secretion system contractile sheath large subunit [Parendozoicomonas sp. Alg238-R29]|uniref:type VI secretion system contractile sheath large subunit n=1 Tax=Parendozoicomonas sp. Alg238-R29 TaxID=2993446 RepID=UPI00248F415A|nr:type VI secretion system contractile sheath large subunit [Parendozoicomonas sp. Alg238-R29]
MSTEQLEAQAGEVTEGLSFLDQAIAVTSQIPQDTTKELLSVLMGQVMEGTVTWDKNLTKTIEDAILALDEKISVQLAAAMHNESFQKLEGSWRGLNKLVKKSELGRQQKVRIIDFTREELLEQFEDAPAIGRSRFFDLVYQHEYGTAGGEPFGLLIGDFEFTHKDEDVALLRYVGEVAAASHAPFIAAASPVLFDFNSFDTFNEGKPVAAGFDTPAYVSWNSFRNSDDSRYVTLTLPKTLSRMPYGENGTSVKEFNFEEFRKDTDGQRRPQGEQDFTWTNAAFDLGLLINNSFAKYGWCTAIRGAENGGKVEALPNFVYKSEAGDQVQQCPTQVNLTDEREKELSDLGLLPLVHYKGSDYGVFMGAQTVQRPKTFVDPDATANAAISARLPYIMASSRVAHYLKVMGRDKIGSSMDPVDVQNDMKAWIGQYVNANAVGNDAKAEKPLREAVIKVEEQTGRPGCYSAIAYLRPWLQLEELTTSLRMVANIPG